MPKHTLYIILFAFALVACTQENYQLFVEAKEQKDTCFIMQDKVIAHRGYWTKDGLPENSRIAFEKALTLNIFGTEFDVRQTKDRKLVVYHDAIFYGMSIAESTYNQLCTKKLANGETVPLLEEFLTIRCNTNTRVKLIIDIKNCNITDLVEQINRYNLQGQVVYITFTKEYCQQLVKFGYASSTYYSNNDTSPTEIDELGFGGVCYKYTFLNSKPTYIEIASNLNIKIMVWTVNNLNEIASWCAKNVYVITDYPDLKD